MRRTLVYYRHQEGIPTMSQQTSLPELKEGELAPDFNLPDDTGRTVKLSDFRGRTVVLYFYPADDTPGCTREACDFRDKLAQIREKNAVVLGVSPDGVGSHKAFKEKYGLTFPLLADPEKKVIAAYQGFKRSTFVIRPDGRIQKIFRNVQVQGHAQQVLDELRVGS